MRISPGHVLVFFFDDRASYSDDMEESIPNMSNVDSLSSAKLDLEYEIVQVITLSLVFCFR